MTFGAAPPRRRARTASNAGSARVSANATRCGVAKVWKPVEVIAGGAAPGSRAGG